MSDECKNCGACADYERCACCGACRNCGKYHAAPYWVWPPYVIYPQPTTVWPPNTTITWGTQTVYSGGNITNTSTTGSN
jgi:hypothetical protein